MDTWHLSLNIYSVKRHLYAVQLSGQTLDQHFTNGRMI